MKTYDFKNEKTTLTSSGNISISKDKYAKAVKDSGVIYIDGEAHIYSIIEFDKWNMLSEKDVNRIHRLSKSISYNSFTILPDSFPECELEEWVSINAFLIVYKNA